MAIIVALRELFDDTVNIENTKTNLERYYMDKEEIVLEHNPEPIIGHRRGLLLIFSTNSLYYLSNN